METKHFTEADLQAIKNAKSFKELYVVAKTILNRMPDNVIGVSDPLSTSNTKDNLDVFTKTIEVLVSAGIVVFNEIPFETKVIELKEQWFKEHTGSSNKHCKPLIEDFFKPLLENQKITTLLLLPNWQDNYLSYYEDSYASQLKKKIIALPSDWVTSNYNVATLHNLKITTTQN